MCTTQFCNCTTRHPTQLAISHNYNNFQAQTKSVIVGSKKNKIKDRSSNLATKKKKKKKKKSCPQGYSAFDTKYICE
jgi:hypothetical protein